MNTNKYLLTMFFTFALFFFAFSFANAAEYYIATDGSNSYSGTLSQPWATFDYAFDQMNGGDTLFVRGGTYDEHIDYIPNGSGPAPQGGTWPNATVLSAYNNETVIVRDSNGPLFGMDLHGNFKYIIIDGIDFDGANIPGSSGGSVRVRGNPRAEYIRFINTDFYNCVGSCINVSSKTFFIEIINCNAYNSGGDPIRDGGVYFSASNGLIDGCKAWGHASGGIFIRADSKYTDAGHNNIVRNNIVWDNGKAGIRIVTGDGNKVYNNVVWGNKISGYGNIMLHTTGHEVYNNTIFDSVGDGILIDSKASGMIIRNNIVYNSGGNDIQDDAGDAIIDNNLCESGCQFTGNPFFVNKDNPAGPDNKFWTPDDGFALQASSPAINAGTSNVGGLFSVDILGNTRPSGDAWDIGAYEYGGTVEPPETCISFTYDWLPTVCPVSEIQTPIVATSLPQGCTGGTPDLTPRTCAYIPLPTTFSTDPYLGNSTNYQPLNTNRWEVINDQGNLRYGINTTNYSQLSNDRLGEYTLIKNRTYNDFTFRAKVKTTENLTSNSYADYNIIFNYQDPNNYHYIVFNSNPTSSGLGKAENGITQDILTTTTSLITDNNYHTVKLQKTGTNIKVYFDNTQILNTTDTTLSQGQIGIGSLNDASLWDDITITTSQTTLQGDLNNDDTVNALDWSIMNANWGTADPISDINNDGIVNTIDFSIMNGEWGQSV